MSEVIEQKVIADIIHGNIELSKFEFFLLKNPIINRLHQILQNSVAYTVYPNMKGTRFEHSLGAMHYTGKIYRNGVINSIVLDEYLMDKQNWIIKLLREKKDDLFNEFSGDGDTIPVKEFKNCLKESFGLNLDYSNLDEFLGGDNFIEAVEKFVGKEFTARNLHCANNEFKAVNILLFQAVRIFGLLHDVGHLPLSHLFEFSIESLLEYLEDKDAEFEKVKRYVGDLDILVGSKKNQIHETIGENITKYIFKGAILKASREKENRSARDRVVNGLITFLIQEIWREIMRADKGAFNSLYVIVSGTIDSDRLDYVQRDGLLSGVSKNTSNIQRIVDMFCLGKNPDIKDDQNDDFLFMPSIQSLDSVEEMLHNRFRIYRYVINHHAVIRSNYIFQKVIEGQLKEEIALLDNNGELGQKDDSVPFLLLDVIKIAIKLSTKEIQKASFEDITNNYIQLTDFWLFSILNKEFTKTWGTNKSEYNLQQLLLNEIYKNKKQFRSVWKRDYEYLGFLKEVGVELIRRIISDNSDLKKLDDRELKSLMVKAKKIKPKYELLLKRTNSDSMKSLFISRQNHEELYSYEEPFVEIGRKILQKIGFFDKKGGAKMVRMLEDKFYEELHKHVLISRVKIKSGVKNCFLLDRKNQKEIYNFNLHSKKVESLEKEIHSSAAFFVFYHEHDTIEDESGELIKIKLVEYILEQFDINKYVIIK